MKYAIVLPDGAADEPVRSLGERTPLQAASIPAIDWISNNGRCGRVVTVPSGFLPGSDVATMSLFGYDPKVYYSGRAPLEAVAKGIEVADDEIVFRCNFVTIVDGNMEDFTAGHISQPEVDRLIADINTELADLDCRFISGVSYRNLMLARLADEPNLKCTPPHDIPGMSIVDFLPVGPNSEWVRNVMTRAEAILDGHDVNHVRRDMGENPATNIWLWGQGRRKTFPTIAEKFGLEGSAIAAVDLIRGIAVCAGLKLIDVPGATGFLDTDYEAKGTAAVAALQNNDIVVVHIEAPDEAGHLGDADAKVAAIESVDRHVVAPLLEALRELDAWRILIAPDHPTPVETRVHSSTPPPFCMAGTGVHSLHKHSFTEEATAESGLTVDPGHELMEFFLKS